MRYLNIISLLLLIIISGCTTYPRIEQLQLGMTTQELAAVAQDCTLSGQSWDTSEYRCRLSVPQGIDAEDRTVNPYILKFKNGRLQEIQLDQNALDREAVRYRTNIGFGYGHGYYPHNRWPHYY